MNKPRCFRLTPVAAAVLAITTNVSAQQADPPKGPPPERIEVTGFRSSLESALADKREDRGIVDVIKAEDAAKFPDTNLAESLQRVPGVVIDRDAGEGRAITVRGLGADFTRVRINGIEALATTGGTDSSGGNNRTRGFDFNVFASELFSTITVRKSASAEVDEGSLGATVDLLTARPFDFKGFKASASLQARYNDLSESTDPRASFLISNTYNDGKVGVLLSGAYSKRFLYEEGFSTVRWDNGASSGGWCAPTGVTANPANSTATTCGPAAQGVARIPGTPETIAAYNAASNPANFHPRLPRYGRLTHEQERTGVTGSFQIRPTNRTLATFDILYSKLDATRQEDFLEAISFSRTAAQGGKPQTSVVQAEFDETGNLIFGEFNGVDIRSEQRFDELNTTFWQYQLQWDQQITDRFRTSWLVGRSTSDFDNPVQTTVTLDAPNVNGYIIDFRDSRGQPEILYPFDPTSTTGPLRVIGTPIGVTPNNITPSEIRIRPQGANNGFT